MGGRREAFNSPAAEKKWEGLEKIRKMGADPRDFQLAVGLGTGRLGWWADHDAIAVWRDRV